MSVEQVNGVKTSTATRTEKKNKLPATTNLSKNRNK
jgi:hypothetical protein